MRSGFPLAQYVFCQWYLVFLTTTTCVRLSVSFTLYIFSLSFIHSRCVSFQRILTRRILLSQLTRVCDSLLPVEFQWIAFTWRVGRGGARLLIQCALHAWARVGWNPILVDRFFFSNVCCAEKKISFWSIMIVWTDVWYEIALQFSADVKAKTTSYYELPNDRQEAKFCFTWIRFIR